MSSVRVALTRPEYLQGIIADWIARGLVAPDALPSDDPLRFLLDQDVPTITAAGYKFAAGHEAVSTVVIGTGSVAHLEENVASILGPPIPTVHVQRLRQLFGAIAEGV
jgi:L-galactose dehydrogenase